MDTAQARRVASRMGATDALGDAKKMQERTSAGIWTADKQFLSVVSSHIQAQLDLDSALCPRVASALAMADNGPRGEYIRGLVTDGETADRCLAALGYIESQMSPAEKQSLFAEISHAVGTVH